MHTPKSHFSQRTLGRSFVTLASSLLLALAASAGAAGCDSDDDDEDDFVVAGASGAPAGSQPTKYAGCERGAIEADLNEGPPGGAPSIVSPTAPRWQGPGVDPATGALRPGNYVLSSTYLALRPEARPRFGELMGPISADLQTRPGLVAISLALSESCASARTLSVWESEDAMYGFVASDAHGAAVRAVGEVSRGQSVVTHWSGNEAKATWAEAAQALARDDGPIY
ncbi:MAG TPA: hypothetical protein VFS00_01260 [Polyangiaceae bacterium]|nr:hypothetical protein [Polyangiaceae bacterium]